MEYVFFIVLLLCLIAPYEPNKANFLGAIIGAGASLIGGALSDKSARDQQRETNEANRPVNQVAEWEEAGINPLFGISSGGYVPHQSARVGAIGDSFSKAGGLLGQALDMQHEQELRETSLEQENDRLNKALDKLVKPSEPGYIQRYGAGLPLPSFGGSDEYVSNGDQGLRQNGDFGADGGTADRFSELRPEHDAVLTGTDIVKFNQHFSDAEVWEGRYGEPGEWLAGMVNIPADAVSTGLYWGQRGVEAYREYIGEPFVNGISAIGDALRPPTPSAGSRSRRSGRNQARFN